MDSGTSQVQLGGRLHLLLEVEDWTKAHLETGLGGDVRLFKSLPKRDAAFAQMKRKPRRGKWRQASRAGLFVLDDHNGVVTSGLQNLLNRWSGLSTTGANVAPGFIGVDNNTTAVTNATAFLHGAGAGTAATTIIKAFSPTIALASNTLTAGATFANADFTSGVFVINKVGWLSTSTDAGTGLIDVIGGTGGTDPFSRTFVVDFTNAGTFTLIPQIAMTAVNVRGSFPSPL